MDRGDDAVSTEGSIDASRARLYGIGASLAVTRRIGASSSSKAARVIRSEIPAPSPQYGQSSSTITARWVLRTEARSASRSSGRTVRRSITSASISSSARASAAARVALSDRE